MTWVRGCCRIVCDQTISSRWPKFLFSSNSVRMNFRITRVENLMVFKAPTGDSPGEKGNRIIKISGSVPHKIRIRAIEQNKGT